MSNQEKPELYDPSWDITKVSENAEESFTKYTQPYRGEGGPKSFGDMLTADNGIRAVKSIATMGQGEGIQAIADYAVDGGISIKNKLMDADVVAVNPQELGPETRLTDKQHLEGLSRVSKSIEKPEMKARFDSAVKSAGDCLDSDGLVDIQDPTKSLNKRLEGEFINDTTLANLSSKALTSAAAVATGGIGGLVAGEAIDYGKEKLINNSRLGNYIDQTEEYLGSCKRMTSEGLEMGPDDMVAKVMKSGTRGDVEGISFDNKGKVSDIYQSEAGGTNMKHFGADDEGGQKIIKSFKDSISDKQSAFFDNADLDSKLRDLTESPREPGRKNSFDFNM